MKKWKQVGSIGVCRTGKGQFYYTLDGHFVSRNYALEFIRFERG